jgi:hypothetical protein
MSVLARVDRGIVFDGRPDAPTLLERLRGRWTGAGGWTHESVLRRAGGRDDGTPRFLLRVDDYPRVDVGPDVFARFHAIVRAASVPYVLGAIPLPANPRRPGDPGREWTDEERAVLAEARPHVEIALHGLTHRAGAGPVPGEIVDRDPESLAREVDEGRRRLEALGYGVPTFIPPFNAVDRRALAVLAPRFRAVHGGPESVRWLGCVAGPCRLDDVWFLPSYPPAYGRAADVLRFVTAVGHRRTPLLIPVTLHWAWEVADGFESVRRLVAALSETAVTLDAWDAGTAWSR